MNVAMKQSSSMYSNQEIQDFVLSLFNPKGRIEERFFILEQLSQFNSIQVKDFKLIIPIILFVQLLESFPESAVHDFLYVSNILPQGHVTFQLNEENDVKQLLAKFVNLHAFEIPEGFNFLTRLIKQECNYSLFRQQLYALFDVIYQNLPDSLMFVVHMAAQADILDNEFDHSLQKYNQKLLGDQQISKHQQMFEYVAQLTNFQRYVHFGKQFIDQFDQDYRVLSLFQLQKFLHILLNVQYYEKSVEAALFVLQSFTSNEVVYSALYILQQSLYQDLSFDFAEVERFLHSNDRDIFERAVSIFNLILMIYCDNYLVQKLANLITNNLNSIKIAVQRFEISKATVENITELFEAIQKTQGQSFVDRLVLLDFNSAFKGSAEWDRFAAKYL